MPLEPHPTDPDKLVMRAGGYNLQKPWVDLTETQIEIIYNEVAKVYRGVPMPYGQVVFGRAVQARLKELNT